jgi:hypothetical protein
MIIVPAGQKRVAVRKPWGTAYGWLGELLEQPGQGGEVAHLWGIDVAGSYPRGEVKEVCGVCQDCKRLNDRPACAKPL